MIGIVSLGVYIPRYRLSGKALAQVWGSGGAAERSIANYDEDSLGPVSGARTSGLASPTSIAAPQRQQRMTACDVRCAGSGSRRYSQPSHHIAWCKINCWAVAF